MDITINTLNVNEHAKRRFEMKQRSHVKQIQRVIPPCLSSEKPFGHL